MRRRLLHLLLGLAFLAAAVALLIYRPPASPAPPAAPDTPRAATHVPDVALVGSVADAGELDLTPAAIPDSAPQEGVIDGGDGDRVVIDQDHDRKSGRVARISADGRTRWVTPLVGHLGGARPPHVLADEYWVYVTHDDGVTALDARTGNVRWHSPGPGDRLLQSGNLLLATGHDAAGGRPWLVARQLEREVFRVALPGKNFDPLPIEDAAGLFVVQTNEASGGAGVSLMIGRGGRVLHWLDRQVVAVMAAGMDRLVLTSRDVVRLGFGHALGTQQPDGPPRWSVPFAGREWRAGGGFVSLAGGDIVAYLYGRLNDSGVRVMRLDPGTGRKVWEVRCPELGVDHSKYKHDAVVEAHGGRLKVTSRGDGGTFVEALDAHTGRSLARRVIEKNW